MKRVPWLVAIPLIVQVVAFFLPLVVIDGPLGSGITVSACDAVSRAMGGSSDGGSASTPHVQALDRLAADLRGTSMPLGGPILLAGSLFALALAYLLALVHAVLFATGRPRGRLHRVWMGLGCAYLVLFLIGAALTQKALAEVGHDNLAQMVVSLVSQAFTRMYEIRIGLGGILVGTSSAIVLACAMLADRRLAPASGPAHSS